MQQLMPKKQCLHRQVRSQRCFLLRLQMYFRDRQRLLFPCLSFRQHSLYRLHCPLHLLFRERLPDRKTSLLRKSAPPHRPAPAQARRHSKCRQT